MKNRPEMTKLRYARLKKVFEGRKKQLEDARACGERFVSVSKYDRARKAWRAARGWD